MAESKTITLEKEAPAAQSRRSWGSGLFEGIRASRDRKRVLSLLETSISAREREMFDQTMQAYRGLSQKDQARVLAKAQKRLIGCSSLVFESERKVSSATVLADFFAEAATALPKDESGERITAPYKETISALKRIIEKDDLRKHDDAAHSAAILSCTRALWELEYGNFSFWEARVLDHATRAYAIRQLLEMPDTEDFDSHGWSLLRANIEEIGPDIVISGSDKKRGFAASMMLDSDEKVALTALRIAVSMDPVPPECLGIAQEIVLGAVAHAQGSVFDPAAVLSPQTERAYEAIALGAAVNVTPYEPSALDSLLSKLVDSRQNARPFYKLTGALLTGTKSSELRAVAAGMESRRVNGCVMDLSFADDRQFFAAIELIHLYASGRPYVLPILLNHVAPEMAEMTVDPSGKDDREKSVNSQKARQVLGALGQVGIGVNISMEPIGQEEGKQGQDAEAKDGQEGV